MYLTACFRAVRFGNYPCVNRAQLPQRRRWPHIVVTVRLRSLIPIPAKQRSSHAPRPRYGGFLVMMVVHSDREALVRDDRHSRWPDCAHRGTGVSTQTAQRDRHRLYDVRRVIDWATDLPRRAWRGFCLVRLRLSNRRLVDGRPRRSPRGRHRRMIRRIDPVV
jgi:hypothetical protein